MKVKLSLVQADLEEQEYELTSFPVVIGRSEQADICICDRWMSRLHCELVVDGGYLLVRDLDSKHGMLVDGEQVEFATLLPGSELKLGLSAFVAHYEAPSGISSTPRLAPTG